jgi:hypothetical protein
VIEMSKEYNPHLVAKKEVNGKWVIKFFSYKEDADEQYQHWYTDDDYDTLIFAKLLKKHVR